MEPPGSVEVQHQHARFRESARIDGVDSDLSVQWDLPDDPNWGPHIVPQGPGRIFKGISD